MALLTLLPYATPGRCRSYASCLPASQAGLTASRSGRTRGKHPYCHHDSFPYVNASGGLLPLIKKLFLLFPEQAAQEACAFCQHVQDILVNLENLI